MSALWVSKVSSALAVGQGAMGIVYRARRADESYDQIVALKIVGAGPAALALVKRFRNERQILAALNHPGIARLIEASTSMAG